jgi:hypothetical protein
VPRPRDPGETAEPLLPSDADLIKASRSGDAAAYDFLFRRHVAAAHGLARQLVRNRAGADDVVAEIFAKILDLLRRGGGPDDTFRPYLLTAVRCAAHDRHRAQRDVPEVAIHRARRGACPPEARAAVLPGGTLALSGPVVWAGRPRASTPPPPTGRTGRHLAARPPAGLCIG